MAIPRLSDFLMGFVDYPDIYWFQLDDRLPATLAVAALTVVTAVYGWRVRRSAAPFVWCFGAVCLLATAKLAHTLEVFAPPEPTDIAGQTFEALIPRDQLDSGMVFATESGFDLWRLLFYLPSRSGVAIRASGTPVRAKDLPTNTTWVIVFDQIPVDFPVAETVHAGHCKPLFLPRGSKIGQSSVVPGNRRAQKGGHTARKRDGIPPYATSDRASLAFCRKEAATPGDRR
ncbi:MAG: hypothetical protein ACRD9L_08980 [Bryobacteraceae bacterium]